MKKTLLIFLLHVSLSAISYSQALYVENKGQWPSEVKFCAALSAGNVWSEANALTFQFYDPAILQYLHPVNGEPRGSSIYKSHVYKVEFLNGHAAQIAGSKATPEYYNYYLGKDENRWASHCSGFARCDYHGLYDGIDMVLYSKTQSMKYDFIVHPNGSVNDIQLRFEGAVPQLVNGEIQIATTVNTIVEKAPFAYQLINGNIKEIPCEFVLKKGTVSFKVEKYNHHYDLIIDPEIAFSTYIGSTASNFGFTACDDSEGNLISGAIVFGSGYPTTTGAFSENFNTGSGNQFDMAISKFNPDGTQLLFSTYLGGHGQETPHSIVADDGDNIVLMGATGSADFPISQNTYQPNFNGGPTLSMSGFFTGNHNDGTDLFITKLSSNGELSASTYLGGTGNDGLNYADQLFYNYGDAFRGEVNVDTANNVYVASVTSSTNFPTINAPQLNYGGGNTDGVLFKMDSTLSELVWSTYVGGNNSDACYALEFDIAGNAAVAGGTRSSNFPHVQGGADNSFNGETDGFLLLLDITNVAFNSGTFVGTNEYDQSYFVQFDAAGSVYTYGQTKGNMPITAGLYGQPNSGQFISKYSSDLGSLEWNTTIGTGSGDIDISPTAFLVSDCEQIYISGWGGEVNHYCGLVYDCYATNSTTIGLPTTNDAFQSTTDGSDFYLCVLNPNASGLLYASFLGGTESSEHVDGGTSRFDKDGSVFQAVCAGCQGNSDFPTTPGVWSSDNPSNGCNIAVFRFNLSAVQAHVSIDGPTEVCTGLPISFVNESVGATSYQWSFGDNETSEAFEPMHIYDTTGTFTISLIGMDDALCITADTTEIQLTILPGVDPQIAAVPLVCLGDEVELNATGSPNLHWLSNPTLSALDIPNPIATPSFTTTYYVADFNECETDTVAIVINVSIPQTSAAPDATICIGDSILLSASGGAQYLWQPIVGLSNAAIASPICNVNVSTIYNVSITTSDGCVVEESVSVTVVNNSPGGNDYPPQALCFGSGVQLQAADGLTWLWSPGNTLSDPSVQAPYAQPDDSITYTVTITNACGIGSDTYTIDVIHTKVEAEGGGTICANDSIEAWASGAQEYYWRPPLYAHPYNSDSTILAPALSTWFIVTGYDEYNCADDDSVYVYVLPQAPVNAGPDQYFNYPGSVILLGNTSGLDFYWWPPDGLSCTDCLTPTASPDVAMYYHLAATDNNGCANEDSVLVKPYYPIWVPNTITPDGDGVNDIFLARGENIEGFQMRIFDRWGLKIFESDDILEPWLAGLDSYYVQNDVYTWIIEYDSIERREKLVGHVTVVR